MQQLSQLIKKQHLNILGLMSGTSCDGLDMALISISGNGPQTEYKLTHSATVSYSQEQQQFLLKLIQNEKISFKEVSQLNFYLAQIWAEMISDFLIRNELNASDIDLVASHGQTIWHEPNKQDFAGEQVSSTLQLGDPSVLAQLINIPVIGDFRVADVALGGQGAPLIPYFDWLHFSQFKQNILSVNIGGISNLTFVPADGSYDKVHAFDCGPGNMLIDLACQNFIKQSYDNDGQFAQKGKLNSSLYNFLKQLDTFSEQKPPKSTGRELYNKSFFEKILDFAQKQNVANVDIIHTLSAYTVDSIYSNYKNFIQTDSTAEIVLIGGGGVHNKFIMTKLAERFNPVPVKAVSEYNVNQDFKEAIGFAVMANETIHHLPSNIPSTTGASRAAVLGKICLV